MFHEIFAYIEIQLLQSSFQEAYISKHVEEVLQSLDLQIGKDI